MHAALPMILLAVRAYVPVLLAPATPTRLRSGWTMIHLYIATDGADNVLRGSPSK